MPGPATRPVLLVDDDADIREAIQQALELFDCPVSTAGDGAEALALLRGGEPPCLILLDLMMPGMSGIELRQELARDPELASIPVVVLSGDRSITEKAAALGVPSVKKPVDLDVLLELVERYQCRSDDAGGAGGR